MRKMMAKLSRRGARVGRLARRATGAARLFKSNAWTAGSYGISAYGVSDRWMRTLRWKASQDTGLAGKQRCVTTSLEVAGMDDPAIVVPQTLVRNWVALWNQSSEAEQATIRSCWRKQQIRLQGPRPWSKVGGPMSAVLLTMTKLGWKAAAPDRWYETGSSPGWWIMDPSMSCTQDLCDAVAAAARSQIWKQAGQHFEGKGVEQGVDLTVDRAHLKALRKEGRYDEVGMLQAILSGG